MRALAADTKRALQAPLAELAPYLTVGMRTGDTPPAERARQDRRWPTALVTTPESLSLMLTREQARAELAGVHTVVVDEWHESIGNKRGVQVQLALARLRRWNPQLVVWGLSATLGNLHEAMHTLVGHGQGRLVQGRLDGLQLRVAVLTHLGRDHLDYHGTPEAYAEAKARLFQPDLARRGVVLQDAPGATELLRLVGIPVTTVGTGPHADLRVTAATVTVHKPEAPVPVPFEDVTVTLRRTR
jgi:Lhr-like helicase